MGRILVVLGTSLSGFYFVDAKRNWSSKAFRNYSAVVSHPELSKIFPYHTRTFANIQEWAEAIWPGSSGASLSTSSVLGERRADEACQQLCQLSCFYCPGQKEGSGEWGFLQWLGTSYYFYSCVEFILCSLLWMGWGICMTGMPSRVSNSRLGNT